MYKKILFVLTGFILLFCVSCGRTSLALRITQIDTTEEYRINEYNINEATSEEITNQKGTFYLLIGRNTCKYCKLFIPAYSIILNELGVENVLYFNVQDKNTVYYDEDDNAHYRDQEYETMVNYLNQGNYLKSSTFEQNGVKTSLPWLYVPRLYKIVDGEIKGSLGTAISVETVNGVVKPLSKTQAEELIIMTRKLIEG